MTKEIIYNDAFHEYMRCVNRQYYHNGNGKASARIRYLMRKYDIKKNEMIDMKTMDEKLAYCNRIHIMKQIKKMKCN